MKLIFKQLDKNIRMHKNISILLPIFLICIDYVAVVVAEYGAFLFRNAMITNGEVLKLSKLNAYLAFPLLFFLFLHTAHLYSSRIPFWQVVQRVFRACFYADLAVVVVLYFSHAATHTSRLFVILFGVLSFVLLVVGRFFVKAIIKYCIFFQIPVLVIGAGKTAEILIKGITHEDGFGYRVIGFLEDRDVTSGELQNYPVLGSFDDIETVIKKTGVQHVIIAAPGIDPYKQGELIYRAQPLVKNVGIIPNLIGIPMGGIEVESLFNEKIMILNVKNNLARFSNIATKFVFDYILTIVGGICILPFLLIIALWVYKDSPGPIIFKHQRIGKNGKVFNCYKFRTMCVDAQKKLENLLENDPEAREEWERDFKLKNDPRITRSGAFLRRTSLDELPQIFNVLKGEMSLVGPRPIVQEELEKYGGFVRDYLSVKPGITGYWQVNGRSDTTYEQRVMMDVWYVHNWSIWLDVMILWRTIKTVLAGQGAY